jgi:hypothetical protein
VKKFVDRVQEAVQQADSLGFSLVDGTTLTIHPPFEVGDDFVAGNTNPEGKGDAIAIRFAAIGRFWTNKADHKFTRPLR